MSYLQEFSHLSQMGLHILFSKITWHNLILFIPVILKAVKKVILQLVRNLFLSLQFIYSWYIYIICLVPVLHLNLRQVIFMFKTSSLTTLMQSYIFLEPSYYYRLDKADIFFPSTNCILVWQETLQKKKTDEFNIPQEVLLTYINF